MTQPTPYPQHTALRLAASGVPVLPLHRGKVPFGNCPTCADNACGGRPNMKTPGPCRCPAPCHAWAAATTDPAVIVSPAWAAAWRQAVCVAYHPGGAGLTVVDLDDADAIGWARTARRRHGPRGGQRGEHWIYRGAMASRNTVRPGVDVKSTMAYARWLGPGVGVMAALPDAVRALAVEEPPRALRVPPALSGLLRGSQGECPHRTPAFLERGVAMAEQHITEASSAVHATVYRTFLAVLSRHGRCGCLTDTHITRLFTAAQSKGETLRHCTDAWTNARTALGM